jgi:hypothetical protein
MPIKRDEVRKLRIKQKHNLLKYLSTNFRGENYKIVEFYTQTRRLN